MYKFNVMAAVGAAVLLTGAATAGEKPQDPNKVVCTYEGDSTTRISRKRICHTRAEWAMEMEARRRDAEQGLDSTGRQRELGNTFRNNVSESGSAPR